MYVLYCLMYGTLNENGKSVVKKITNFSIKKYRDFSPDISDFFIKFVPFFVTCGLPFIARSEPYARPFAIRQSAVVSMCGHCPLKMRLAASGLNNAAVLKICFSHFLFLSGLSSSVPIGRLR